MLPFDVLHFEEGAVIRETVPNGAALASFSTPLKIPTGHATRLALVVVSDAIVTITRRFRAASGVLEWDDAGTVLVAGTVTPIATPATFELGQEVEILVTNASGGDAIVTAWVCARS